MDLTPYLEALRRDLAASAAPAGEEVARTAELLAGSLEAAARLGLLEALSDAAAEITTKLDSATVEVRLKGREADLVVTETAPVAAPAPVPPPPDPGGDLARVTLRIPEPLKESVERAAAAEGISVNAWLVRAVSTAVHGLVAPPLVTTHNRGRRLTGYAQA
jgi:hypothetical protein